MEKYGVGTKHITNEGYEITIIEKLKNDQRKVRFENGYELICDRKIISKGKIKNPYHFSVCGVGYFGVGEYKAGINGKHTSMYTVWHDMLKRCYDEKTKERHISYKRVTVCEEWLNFQVFAKWYKDNLPKIDEVKFHLDKDLLQENVINKTYSPETCVLLPHNVNTFLANKFLNNTSGYIGVCWAKQRKKWQVRINLFGEGKEKYLGCFPTPELASETYKEARKIEAEKVKEYLRGLNYLPEETIQLIR